LDVLTPAIPSTVLVKRVRCLPIELPNFQLRHQPQMVRTLSVVSTDDMTATNTAVTL